MKAIVISQPMFLPWVGMFEQLKLSDVFVHYDDVKFPQGRSFINRIQIKTKDGVKWLTVPIDKKNSGKLIYETLISYSENWVDKHLNTIKHAFYQSKHRDDVNELVTNIYNVRPATISEFNIFAFELLASYFGIKKELILSSSLGTKSNSSQKLLDICKKLNATRYITGLGALNYIDYNLFEEEGISIEYMMYKKLQYNQIFGDFTPYVSVLDLIANEGRDGARFICSNSVYWRYFKND